MKLSRSIESFVKQTTSASGFIALILISLVTGCTSNPKLSHSTKIRKLESELRKKQSQVDDLREKNSVLERRVKTAPPVEVSSQAAASGHLPGSLPDSSPDTFIDAPTAAKPADGVLSLTAMVANANVNHSESAGNRMGINRKLPPKLKRAVASDVPDVLVSGAATSADSAQSSEQLLYGKMLETYRHHKTDELQKTLALLLKNYPDSIYADNSLYLAGLAAIESGDWIRGQYYMDRVLHDYPHGNKAVAALLTMAMIEKQKGKSNSAKTILKTVQSAYPGSPEAARALFEAKLIDHEAASKKGGL